MDYVRNLGADEVIDYNAQDFTRVISGCDAVFDTVGGDVAQKSFAVLRPGGRAPFIASGAQAPKPERGDVTSLRPAVGRARASASPNLWSRAPCARPRSSFSAYRKPPKPIASAKGANFAASLSCRCGNTLSIKHRE